MQDILGARVKAGLLIRRIAFPSVLLAGATAAFAFLYMAHGLYAQLGGNDALNLFPAIGCAYRTDVEAVEIMGMAALTFLFWGRFKVPRFSLPRPVRLVGLAVAATAFSLFFLLAFVDFDMGNPEPVMPLLHLFRISASGLWGTQTWYGEVCFTLFFVSLLGAVAFAGIKRTVCFYAAPVLAAFGCLVWYLEPDWMSGQVSTFAGRRTFYGFPLLSNYFVLAVSLCLIAMPLVKSVRVEDWAASFKRTWFTSLLSVALLLLIVVSVVGAAASTGTFNGTVMASHPEKVISMDLWPNATVGTAYNLTVSYQGFTTNRMAISPNSTVYFICYPRSLFWGRACEPLGTNPLVFPFGEGSK
jgi:hypothetical protein